MSETLVKKVKENLQYRIQEYKDAWANGQFTTESVDGTAQMNAKWLGRCEAETEILELIEEWEKEWEDE